MGVAFKALIRVLIPSKKIRSVISGVLPRIKIVDTYLLKRPEPVSDLHEIDSRYLIRKIEPTIDIDKLKKVYSFRYTGYFEKRIKTRLNESSWLGIGVIDKTNDELAYVAWIVQKNITKEQGFWLDLKPNQCFFKDDYCTPHHRHRGLHTRAFQERINYCIDHEFNEIFIGIDRTNKKGKNYISKNGFHFYQCKLILVIQRYAIYQELFSFVKDRLNQIVTCRKG